MRENGDPMTQAAEITLRDYERSLADEFARRFPRSKAHHEKHSAALLDGTVGAMVKGMPGLATGGGVTAVSIDGHAGKQIQGTANGAGFHARLVVTSRNLFMVQGLYDPRDPAAKAATEAFVASFHLPK